MSRYTKDDIFRMVEEEDVEFIRLQFTDILEHLRILQLLQASLRRHLITNACLTVLLLKAL